MSQGQCDPRAHRIGSGRRESLHQSKLDEEPEMTRGPVSGSKATHSTLANETSDLENPSNQDTLTELV